MREGRLELPLRKEPDPKSGASANSATLAHFICHYTSFPKLTKEEIKLYISGCQVISAWIVFIEFYV